MRIQDFFAACQHLTKEELDVWVRLASSEEDARAAIIYLKELGVAASDVPNKAAIHHAAYPDLPYRTKRFNQLIERLIVLLEQVIGLQRLADSPILQNRLLLEWQIEKGLNGQVKETYQKMADPKDECAEGKNKNSHDFLAASIEYYWWDLKMQNDLNLPLTQSVTELFENYISVQSLSLQLSLSSLAQWKGQSVTFPFGEYLVQKLSKEEGRTAMELQLLRMAIRLTNSKGQEDFQHFEQLLRQYGQSLDDNVRHLLHALKINYLIRAYNNDSTIENMRMLLDAYKESASLGFLMNRNVLSYQTYLNVVTVAAACGEIEWAEEFVAHFRNNVPVKYCDSAFAFNMGKIAYQKGIYDESLDWLQKARLRDPNQFYAVRQLVIRNYYAKKDWKAIHAVLNSLKIYAIRKMKADPSYHSVFRTNYVANIKRLLDIRLHPGDTRNAKRLEEIRQSNSTDHLWIVQEAQAATG